MDAALDRWRRLAPHAELLTPSGRGPFPTVLMFHGCGGVRVHLHAYARAAVSVGWGALLVDSFSPRGWTRDFAKTMVCTGLIFRGRRRAGDVLAAIAGARALPLVDPERLVLAGWSHGGWAIMDLMSMPLVRSGEAGLSDAPQVTLNGVRAAFLAYPYVGVASASRGGRPWPRAMDMLVVAPRQDHLASVRRHMRALASAVAAGSEVAVWGVEGTHAFDEPGLMARIMRYDENLSRQAMNRFAAFLAAISPIRPSPRPE
jgi:dienelactone hydrolase